MLNCKTPNIATWEKQKKKGNADVIKILKNMQIFFFLYQDACKLRASNDIRVHLIVCCRLQNRGKESPRCISHDTMIWWCLTSSPCVSMFVQFSRFNKIKWTTAENYKRCIMQNDIELPTTTTNTKLKRQTFVKRTMIICKWNIKDEKSM
jgi:hypothetical protein